jgi:hypothetical protein
MVRTANTVSAIKDSSANLLLPIPYSNGNIKCNTKDTLILQIFLYSPKKVFLFLKKGRPTCLTLIPPYCHSGLRLKRQNSINLLEQHSTSFQELGIFDTLHSVNGHNISIDKVDVLIVQLDLDRF